jgi:hypothetical protein
MVVREPSSAQIDGVEVIVAESSAAYTPVYDSSSAAKSMNEKSFFSDQRHISFECGKQNQLIH